MDSGYKTLSRGNFPYIASYTINVADTANMFRRVPFGNARLLGSKGSFYYIFKSPTTYFHTVGKRETDENPFISRTCLMDEGREDKYAPITYKSYIDIQFRLVV